MAALGCELISALLYSLVFNLSWQPHPWLLSLPLLGAVLVTGAGWLGTRRALNVSPLTVLRDG
jgi:putative ABC transport system permease protein